MLGTYPLGIMFTPYPIGCLYLIKSVENNLSGKHVVIIGRSNLEWKTDGSNVVKEKIAL